MNSLYKKVYNNSYLRTGNSSVARKVALEALKRSAASGSQVLQFAVEADSSVQIISNSQNGTVEVDILLANKNPRKTDGKWFSDEALADLAKQINTEGSTFPDVEHQVLNRARATYGNNVEAIANAVKQEKGMFKSVKAAVKDGKLWIRAIFDAKYKQLAEQFKKVSIEALGTVDKITGMINSPRYLGFTFTRTPELDGVGLAI